MPILRALFTALVLAVTAAGQFEDFAGELIFNATGLLPPDGGALLNGDIQVPPNKTSAVVITLVTSVCSANGTACETSPLGTVDPSAASLQCYNVYLGPSAAFVSNRVSNFQVIYISPNSTTYLTTNQSNPIFTCRVTPSLAPVKLPVDSDDYYTLMPTNPSVLKWELKAMLQETPIVLVAEEQAAAGSLFEKCCGEDDACEDWKAMAAAAALPPTQPYTDLCQLQGSICNTNGSLVQLDIGGNNMSCAYPVAELASFSNVEYLFTGVKNAVTNEMTGDFGAIIANVSVSLPRLKEWDISYNPGITGSLEAEDAGGGAPAMCTPTSTGLQLFKFGFCGITGGLPDCMFGANSTLRYLFGSGSNASGTLPPSLSAATKLIVFQVASAKLTGPLPATLSPTLVRFNVSNNLISGEVLPSVGSTSVLTTLDVSHNDIVGTLTTDILQAPSLYVIDLRGNQLTGLSPEWETDAAPFPGANDSNVRYLLLGGNFLQSGFPVAVGYLGAIDVLDVSGTGMTGELPDLKPGTFNSLEMLYAQNNNLTGGIPDSWQQAGIFSPSLDRVQVFDVTNNSLTGDIPSWFITPSLNPPYLGLSGNDFDNACEQPYSDLGLCTDPSAITPSTAPGRSPGASREDYLAPPSPDDGDSGDDGGLSGAAIAGIVLIVLAVAVLAGLAYVKVIRKRRNAAPRQYMGRFERFEDAGPGEDGDALHVELGGVGGGGTGTGGGYPQQQQQRSGGFGNGGVQP